MSIIIFYGMFGEAHAMFLLVIRLSNILSCSVVLSSLEMYSNFVEDLCWFVKFNINKTQVASPH